MYMFFDPANFDTKDKVFAELKRRGAAQCIVAFSGGNDSGGADSIRLLDKTKTEIATLTEGPWPSQVFDKATGTTKVGRLDDKSAEFEGDFTAALVQPVYERHFTFAGDFYVHGTITWDVERKTISGKEQQEVSSWEQSHW